MVRSEAAYWLGRADEEARRAAASTVVAVRRAHEALETAYRDHAAQMRDRDIVLGPPAPNLGSLVVATASGYTWYKGRSAQSPSAVTSS